MLLSFGILLFFGLLGSLVFQALKLPGLLGMLIAGVLIGPYGLDLLDETLLAISYDLRVIALIIVLLRAGLGLNRKKILKAGKTSIFMAFIPSILEGFAVLLFAMLVFDFTFIQGGILGFIIAAVSPAVVVPSMLELIKRNVGMNKSIPVMILSAASLDDVIAITIFTTFLGFYFGTTNSITIQVLNIPIAIFLGIMIGIVVGSIFVYTFNKLHIRDSKKVIVLLALGMFLVSLERGVEDIVLVASYLSVMTLGLTISEILPKLGSRLSIKFDKIWVSAEIVLFVLVGAAVNPLLALSVGVLGIALIAFGLLFRSIGVLLAVWNSGYNYKEKWFTVIAYWPKATVQAALGSIPLTLGVEKGELILALAVLSIIVSAPLGAIMIKIYAKRNLHQGEGLI